ASRPRESGTSLALAGFPMTMLPPLRARLAAGAFLLLAAVAAPLAAAERVRFALERGGGACPAAAQGAALGLVALEDRLPVGTDEGACAVRLALSGLTDAEIDQAAGRLATASGSPALILRLPAGEPERTIYAIKRLSSAFRGASLAGQVGLDAPALP